MTFFGGVIIGLAETLAVKRKSPHFIEGYNTWCGLLCDYRTTSCTEIKDLKAKIDAFLAKIDPEGINLALDTALRA